VINITVVTFDPRIAPLYGSPLLLIRLLLLLLLRVDAATFGGHVRSRLTASSQAGSTVACRLVLQLPPPPLLLPLPLLPLPLLPWLLQVRMTLPRQFVARLLHRDRRCRPTAMSTC
jgi:hypothetical protein